MRLTILVAGTFLATAVLAPSAQAQTNSSAPPSIGAASPGAPYAGETPVRTRKAAAHQAAHHKKKKKSFASKMREKEKQLKGLLGSKQNNPQVGR
jgi:hypothetical protein